MQNTNRVRKRCDRCNHETWADRKERVCKQLQRNAKGFKTGWRCPGKLQFLDKQRQKTKRRRVAALPPIPPGVGIGHVLTEEYQAQVRQLRGKEGREKAAKALAAADAKIKHWKTEEKRARNLVRKWEKAARHSRQRSHWTDEQFTRERDRLAKAAQVGSVKRRLSKAAGVTANGAKTQLLMHVAAPNTFAQDGSPACRATSGLKHVTHTLADVTCQRCRSSRHFKYAKSKRWRESDEGAADGSK